jgi:Tol biopolymer transport system component
MLRSTCACCLVALLSLLAGCSQTPAPSPNSDADDIGPWTDTNYPSYIKRITHFGQRADWSPDGKRILFMEKTYGDVYEVDLESGTIRGLTLHYYHHGYTRALYLSNGDILLSGSRTYDPEHHSTARHETAELWVLSKDLDKPPVALGQRASEGPTVSRTQLRIVWTVDQDNFPEQFSKPTSQIWLGEIDYSGGNPKLVNKQLILDSHSVDHLHRWETQNFIGPDEKKITWVPYDWQSSEVMLLDLETKEITNLTNSPDVYDEPEGIFPDGQYTLVESSQHTGGKGYPHIDLFKLALDGSGSFERITRFNEEGVYKASNPVVSDDGKYIAFQIPRLDQIAGVGQGIYILDIEAAGQPAMK